MKFLNLALVIPLVTLMLSSCYTGAPDFLAPEQPKTWHISSLHAEEENSIEPLKSWWQRFHDPALDSLIAIAMTESPDRNIAKARIIEARGLRRTSRASLFPQIGASASGGREDAIQSSPDGFYDVRFDASYELDIFGVNRRTDDAALAQIETLDAEFHDVTLTLIADITRSYIDYRAAQKQVHIAEKNLKLQEKTLELIVSQFELGEAPRLDVERSENIVNTTRASIPEFQRQANAARLQLSVLTGQLPEAVLNFIAQYDDDNIQIPGQDLSPVFLAPSDVLNLRPDIRAAQATLERNTKLAEAVTASLWPNFTISGFYGLIDNAVENSTNIWDIAIGAAVSVLDFGSIEGQIDAARALEVQSFEAYRKVILEAIVEVETALSDTANINKQRDSLEKAFENATKAFELSETLYREGEVSFLDVLDAQRTVNEADSALVNAEAAQAQSIVRLYKSLGVY